MSNPLEFPQEIYSQMRVVGQMRYLNPHSQSLTTDEQEFLKLHNPPQKPVFSEDLTSFVEVGEPCVVAIYRLVEVRQVESIISMRPMPEEKEVQP